MPQQAFTEIIGPARIWLGMAVVGLVQPSAPAQEWTEKELEARIQGFLEPDTQTHLEQIAALVQHQADAGHAIAARIHGDHREYLLKVQRLIDQLTDERWPERERAERTLIEVGARARRLLEERKRAGELLEERIRCERILRRIDERGTEREEQETQILRGLVDTALYLDPSARLQRALLSALGHTDPGVAQRAARALGSQGYGDHVKALAGLLDRGSTLRSIAVASVAMMKGEEALAQCRAWLSGDDLNLTEKILLIRVLREHPDGAAVLAETSRSPDPSLAAAATLELPPANAKPVPVRVTFLDGSSVTEPFRGLHGDRVVISSPVKGLERVDIPMNECRVLEFKPSHEKLPSDACRVFTKQGSLILGKLLGMRDDALQLQSPLLGVIEIPRGEIQGIALDPALDRLIGASTKVDRIRLKSQELLDGTCLEIADGSVKMRGEDGTYAVELNDVGGILFRRPQHAPADQNLYARIDLVGGDKILGHIAGINESSLGIIAPSIGPAQIPLQAVSRIEMDVSGGALWGFTLIADYSDNRLVEVDENGNEVFVLEDVHGAWDVECLDNGNLLVTEFSVSRVQELTRSGEQVWSYEDLRNPYDADRLPNGNTLIADTFRGRVIEVNQQGEIVWQYADGIRPFDVDRLANGNTLIADVLKDRVIEINRAGEIVWEKTDLPSVHDADRLPNGNTLITLRTLRRVIEIDSDGEEVFRLSNLNAPSDADRLANGHTLVAENNMVREFDRKGATVWKKAMTWAVEVNRY